MNVLFLIINRAWPKIKVSATAFHFFHASKALLELQEISWIFVPVASTQSTENCLEHTPLGFLSSNFMLIHYRTFNNQHLATSTEFSRSSEISNTSSENFPPSLWKHIKRRLIETKHFSGNNLVSAFVAAVRYCLAIKIRMKSTSSQMFSFLH